MTDPSSLGDVCLSYRRRSHRSMDVDQGFTAFLVQSTRRCLSASLCASLHRSLTMPASPGFLPPIPSAKRLFSGLYLPMSPMVMSQVLVSQESRSQDWNRIGKAFLFISLVPPSPRKLKV